MKTKDQLKADYDSILKDLGNFVINGVLANKVLSRRYQEALQIQLQINELEQAEHSDTIPPDPPTKDAAESNLGPATNRGFYEDRFEKIK